MKKYLSIFFATVTAVALIASCEKNGDNDGGKLDADDPGTVKTANLVAYFPLESEAETVVAEGITYSKKGGAAGFVKGMRGMHIQTQPLTARTFHILTLPLVKRILSSQ